MHVSCTVLLQDLLKRRRRLTASPYPPPLNKLSLMLAVLSIAGEFCRILMEVTISPSHKRGRKKLQIREATKIGNFVSPGKSPGGIQCSETVVTYLLLV